MYRQPVNSSRMISVGYEDEVLEIEFTDGAIYQYYDVSEQEYINFIGSGSLGRALSILDKRHRYKRIR